MSKTTDCVIEQEEKGLITYDEDFSQYVKAIENDPEYVKNILEAARKRDEHSYPNTK